MEELSVIAVFGFVIMLSGLSIWWTASRSHAILQDWADRHGYDILSKEYCWFRRGPYFWRSSKGQTVYRVAVRDHRGQRRTGWVRCGGWFLGLLTSEADVTWD